MEVIFNHCIDVCANFLMDGVTPSGGGGAGGGDIGVPTNLLAVSAKHFKIDLTWNSVTSATGYELRARENTSTVWTTFSGPTNSATAQKLKENVLYQFQVRATDGVNFGPWTSTVVSATVLLQNDDSENLYSGTVYYVSNSGNDSAAGTSQATAWQTLSKVNATLAAASGPVKILFNRGNTWTGSIAVPSIAGASTLNRVQFGAYGSGNRPIIQGSENIASSLTWAASADPNIWYVDVVLPGVGMLIVDGSISYPASSSQQVIDSGTATSITDTAFLTGTSYVGAQCIHKGSKYSAEAQTIVSHDTVNGVVTWTEVNNPNDGKANYGYYISNHPSFMANVGDWWFDTSINRLYFYTGGGAPTQEIRAPQYSYAFDVQCQFVEISDINSRYFHEGSIYCNQNGLKATFNDISFNYNSAIFMSGTLSGLDVMCCEIHDISGTGIYGLNTSNAVIKYNHIHHISDLAWGRLTGIEGGGEAANNNFYSGVSFKPSENNLIEYNYVHHIGYIGIRSDGQNHIIRRNYVHNTLLQYGDGAGIYMFDVAGAPFSTTGNIIEYNIVHDSIGSLDGVNPTEIKYLTAGIYLDQGCTFCEVRGNVIYNCTSDALKINYQNKDHLIENNILYGTGETALHFSNRANIANQTINHVIQNNVIVAIKPTVDPIYILNFLDEAINGKYLPGDFLGNKFVHPYTAEMCFKKQQAGGASDEDLTFAQFVTDHGETGTSVVAGGSWSYIDEATARQDMPIFSNPDTDLKNDYIFSGSYTDTSLVSVTSPITLTGYSGAILIKV